MKSFTMKLQDATRSEEIANVTSFVGEDASGSFGLCGTVPNLRDSRYHQ